MDIFSVFTLCGGLAFFLYGMTVMSKSLEKMAGGKLERMLKRMTSNPFKSLLLGAGITIAIQSSSAMTVMLVGLVNSGVMELGQTIGVIMGSNIGTTLTAWILSLTGIESENVFVNLLKPENFSPLIALAGILLIMGSKRQRRRDVGRIMMGFAVLMYGMELMSGAVSPLAEMPEFAGLLTAFENPLLGVLVGAVFTGIIQSSSASVGILQALATSTGAVSLAAAMPIIMGQNIGTTVTALIASAGTNKNARRTAFIHLYFNIVGTVVFLTGFYALNAVFPFPFYHDQANAFNIAVVHTVFNVVTTAILLPFNKLLVRLAVPTVTAQLVNALYNIVDRMFVGNFNGTSALAGLSVCFPLSYMMMAFGLMCSAGGSTCFSLFSGQGDTKRMNRAFGNAFVLVCGFELLLTVFLLALTDPLLQLFGVTETAYPYAVVYYRIVALGCLFQGLSQLFCDFVRVSGKPILGMCVTGIGVAKLKDGKSAQKV